MQKNKEEKYAGDLNVEIDEIKKVMTEKKEQDFGSSFTRACDALLTIVCC